MYMRIKILNPQIEVPKYAKMYDAGLAYFKETNRINRINRYFLIHCGGQKSFTLTFSKRNIK